MFISKKTVRIISSKRGSATVEAAIFLPVFFLAMLSVILLIRLVGVEENMMQLITKEAVHTEKEAYLTQLPVIPDTIGANFAEGAAAGALMILNLRENAQSLPIEKIRCSYYRYLYEKEGTAGLIFADIEYKSVIPFPSGFRRTLNFEKKLLFRGFIGSIGNSSPMEFSEMEKDEPSDLVYVFPRAGERYHAQNCSVITTYAHEAYLTNSMLKNYSSCKLCDPNKSMLGSKVYYFPKGGRAFHRKTCSLVERYVVEMDRQEAMKKGYTPCRICGGG
jgi:hypothetical protein